VAFGPYLLDSRARSLSRAGWQDVAVGDNSLEKLVSKLRRHLDAEDLNRYIKTVPRQGYQFRPAVRSCALADRATGPSMRSSRCPHGPVANGSPSESRAARSVSTHSIRSGGHHDREEHPERAGPGGRGDVEEHPEARRADQAPAVRTGRCPRVLAGRPELDTVQVFRPTAEGRLVWVE
jgi:hypothetical protein